MKIVMKKLAAGPEGCMRIGQEYDVAPAKAKELIDGDYAEASPVNRKHPVDAAVEVETTDARATLETRESIGDPPAPKVAKPPRVRNAPK